METLTIAQRSDENDETYKERITAQFNELMAKITAWVQQFIDWFQEWIPRVIDGINDAAKTIKAYQHRMPVTRKKLRRAMRLQHTRVL